MIDIVILYTNWPLQIYGIVEETKVAVIESDFFNNNFVKCECKVIKL